MKNNNSRIIFDLSMRHITSSKSKFLVISISIILTTVLFTTVLTLASGLKESFELQAMRQVGTKAHGTVKYLTSDEVETLYGKDYVKEYGKTAIVGLCLNKELDKRITEIRYADENYSNWTFSKPIMGRLPESKDEIATDKIVLQMLGIKPEIGSKVHISYELNGVTVDEDFKISGIYEGDIFSSASQILVSEEYLNGFLKKVNQKYNKDNNIYQGLYCVDFMFFNTIDIESNINRLLNDSGFDVRNTSIGINWGYISSDEDRMGYFVPLIIALGLVTITGYMIINNIFSIFIVKDIKGFSLLKAIGTTNRQIRNIILIQLILVSIVSIPIGIGLGYFIGNILLPYFLQSFNTSYMTITFNPMIYVMGSLISAVTVVVSFLKPARTAAMQTPIEGLSYQDNTILSDNLIMFDGKLYRMAFLNLQRNKRKIISVIISIALSLTLLSSLYMTVSGFDKEKFIEKMVISDFQIAQNGYYTLRTLEKNLDIAPDYIELIEKFDGFESGGGVYYKYSNHKLSPEKLLKFEEFEKSSESYNNDDNYKQMIDEYVKSGIINSQLYGVDPFLYDKIDIMKGEFDQNKFDTGKYVVVFDYDGKTNEGLYDIGDKINIDLGNGVNKEYEVMAIGNMKYNISVRYYIGNSLIVILPSSQISKNIGFELINYNFDISDNDEKQVDLKLNKFVNSYDRNYNYKSKFSYENDFNNNTRSYWLVGGALIIITAMIGILNFINIIFTSIESRKYEFAIMRSVGMTSKQLTGMIILEGVIVAVLSFLLGLISSVIVAFMLIKTVISEIWFYTFKLNLYPIVFILVPLLLVATVIPAVACRSFKGKSVTETLCEINF